MHNLTCLSRALAGAALSALSCFAAAAGGAAYTVSTVAGSSVVGDGSTALAAQLGDAEGLALDRQGNVYIVDASNHRVRKVTANGVIQTVAGTGFPGFSGDGGPGGQAQLNSPYGVAADAAGNVYIADLGNNRVRKVWPDGTITTVAGSGLAGSDGDGGPAATAQLNGPRNTAVDSQGNLYISEFYGHRIRIVTTDGSIQTLAGTGSPGSLGDNAAATAAQLSYPAGIAIDFTGALYIADSGNLKIRRVFAGLITTIPLGAFTLTLPTGVASDGAGGFYVADSSGKRVLRRTASGAVFIAAGVGSPGAAPLDSPRDIAADAFGELFIADGHRVRLMSSSGYATTFAGDGTFGFRGDGGPAVLAVLNGPAGVAVDTMGNLYVADSLNHRVRKVTAGGVIATVAGTGVAGDSADGLPPTGTALDGPQGLFLDAAEVLWIDEYFGQRVRRLTPAGGILTMAGSGAAGFNGDSRPAISAQLQAPGQAAMDAAGNLYIADSGNNRIRKVAPSGLISTYAGSGSAGFGGDGGQAIYAQLNLPRGLAVDSAGNLYIADTANNCIRMVQPGGLISTVAGGGAYTLTLPRGVTVGFDQNIYIADTGNHRIAMLTPAGDLSTIAGTGGAGFVGDGGDSLSAQFNNPSALAMDTAGAIYVADLGNNRIRKLSPSIGGGVAAPSTLLASPGLMNAASLQSGPVAPGEIVSIFAAGLGPATAIAGAFDANGMLGNLISETQVLFDGRAAPMLLAQQGQINVQVPYEVAGLSSTHVQVYHAGTVVVDVTAPVAAAIPGLFALSGQTGQALAFNQDGSPTARPVPPIPVRR
jgi:sugar lactone lactonase YvrE